MSRQLQDILSSGEVTDIYQEGTDEGDKLQTKDEIEAMDDARLRWRGKYVIGNTYNANDIVYDLDWLMVANKTTSDRAAVIPAGDPVWVQDMVGTPAFTTPSLTSNTVIFGHRYTITEALQVNMVRLQFPAGTVGMEYTVYIVRDPLGADDVVMMARNRPITVTGSWVEARMNFTVVIEAGEVFDLVVEVRNVTSPTTVQAVYDYKRTTGGPVPAGEAWHQKVSGVYSPIRFSGIDFVGTDRNSLFSALEPGDTFALDGTGFLWTITSITVPVTGTWDLHITPTSRASAQVGTFSFTNYPAVAIPYIVDPTFFASTPTVQGFVGTDYQGVTLGDGAYGIDFEVIPVDKSDDWDIMVSR